VAQASREVSSFHALTYAAIFYPFSKLCQQSKKNSKIDLKNCRRGKEHFGEKVWFSKE
jgi:hypothetical protein